MSRACACIVAALLAAGCGQRGPLVLPPSPGGLPSTPAPVAPALEPFISDVPLSPTIADSPDPNATGSVGDTMPSAGRTGRTSDTGIAPSGPAPVPTR